MEVFLFYLLIQTRKYINCHPAWEEIKIKNTCQVAMDI